MALNPITKGMSNAAEMINENFSMVEQAKSYSYTQIDRGVDGIDYEVPLYFFDMNEIFNQPNKQFLVNMTFTFGSSIHYSGHLTGILTLDGYYDGSAVLVGANFDVISERNTSGNVNGNLGNPPNFFVFFRETGTQTISPTANDAKIVFRLPKAKYSAGNTNKLTIKPLNDIYMENY